MLENMGMEKPQAKTDKGGRSDPKQLGQYDEYKIKESLLLDGWKEPECSIQTMIGAARPGPTQLGYSEDDKVK